jgi:carbamoyltransferase
MKVLGIASDFHDSSAALVVDGRLVASSAEERFTRNKHDSSFPKFASEFCLREAGLKAGDLDLVVFYEKPFSKWIRVLESSLVHWPTSRSEFVESQGEWLGRKLWTRAILAQKLGISANRVREVEHHRSHLVQAIVGAPYARSAVLTVDAVGERSTASMARAWWEGEVLQLEELGKTEFPHSLGLFYSAITAFLGFKPMNDECSVMALAAFGVPKYKEAFRKILQLEANGFWSIDPSFLQFDRFLSAPWTDRFLQLFGRPRDAGNALGFSSLRETQAGREDQHWADLAASAQFVLEEALLHSARHLRLVSGERNLCFAGGVALNCVANSRLVKEAGFAQLHVPVEPGDGGASIGAAFAGYFESARSPRKAFAHPVYLGAKGNGVEALAREIDVEHSWEYQRLGARCDRRKWNVQRVSDPEARADLLAEALAAGRVAGLFQGRSELGPRALGHRSLLFRPDSVELAERVSGEIKDRAPFRPYAISLLSEDATEILDLSGFEGAALPLRLMQLAVPVRSEWRSRLRAGLHVDGSTRPQLVSEADDSFFHAVLCRFKKRRGLGALVNTSMNESGYPLVGSSEEALMLFSRTSLDLLVVDDLLIGKE